MSSASAPLPSQEPLTLPPDWHYETTVAQIETIIQAIESGHLDLADLFEQFSLAIEYLRQCDQFLEGHQAKMDLLIETLADTVS